MIGVLTILFFTRACKNDMPWTYLPCDLESGSCWLVEAITMSRNKSKRKCKEKNTLKLDLKKFLKRNEYLRENTITFEVEKDCEEYLGKFSKNIKCPYSKKEVCTILYCNGTHHFMQLRYHKCACSEDCNLKFKSHSCLKTHTIELTIGRQDHCITNRTTRPL